MELGDKATRKNYRVGFLQLQIGVSQIAVSLYTVGVIDEAANQWARDVCASRDIGVIAGTVPIGVGQLVTSFEGENDGTVAVSETKLPGIKDHICLAVTHKGLVVSNNVIDQAAAFLKRGEFLRDL